MTRSVDIYFGGCRRLHVSIPFLFSLPSPWSLSGSSSTHTRYFLRPEIGNPKMLYGLVRQPQTHQLFVTMGIIARQRMLIEEIIETLGKAPDEPTLQSHHDTLSSPAWWRVSSKCMLSSMSVVYSEGPRDDTDVAPPPNAAGRCVFEQRRLSQFLISGVLGYRHYGI